MELAPLARARAARRKAAAARVAATKAAHRPEGLGALRAGRTCLGLIVEHGARRGDGALPAVADALLEAPGRRPSEHLASGRGEDIVALTRRPAEAHSRRGRRRVKGAR